VKAALLLTDPPYGVDVGTRNAETGGGTRARILNDDLPVAGLRKLWTGAFRQAERVLADRAAFYVFSAQGPLIVEKAASLAEAGLKWRHELIWVKRQLVLGRCDWHYRHEPVMYGWRAKGAHAWHGDRSHDSVLEFGRDAKGFGHASVKPVQLLVAMLSPSTLKGEAVLDLFLGSGSTLLACERSGRRCLGMELDPKYAGMAVSRWQNETGRKAELEK
jgi:site-specific DNA-methyltransferase (adenine-specific)